MVTIGWIRRPHVRGSICRARATVFLSIALLLGAGPASAAPPPTVSINGVPLAAARVVRIVVDRVPGVPDAAEVHIVPRPRSPIRVLDALDVVGAGGGAGASIFKGEIVSIEPTFDDSGQRVLLIRGVDRLHRLTRERKTRVFENASDADVVARIAAEHGLVPQVDGAAAYEQHREVAQIDQTDLEFLRVRAEAIGFALDAIGVILRLGPAPDGASVALGCPPRWRPNHVALDALRARIASPRQVQRVIVNGWDPVKKQKTTGRAQGPTIDLSRPQDTKAPLFGQTVDLGAVDALATTASTHGTARGALHALTAVDVAVEVATDGTPLLRPGATAKIAGRGVAFDGQYYVTGVSHRYTQTAGAPGYVTLARLVRTDRGLYVLPEADEEVLVGFEHGDVARPIVLGSLWNNPAQPSESACRVSATPE